MSTQPLGGPGDAVARAGEAEPNRDLDEAGRVPRSRAESAVNLRIHGASWTEIANALEFVSPFHARTVVERTLAEDAGGDPSDRAGLRNLMDRRLNRLLRSLMPRATNPADDEHLPYSRAALGVLDRIIRLHGLDAPTETVVHTPDASRIEEFVRHLTAMQRTEIAAQEAEIIDVEIVDE